jgi:hypothetical protein
MLMKYHAGLHLVGLLDRCGGSELVLSSASTQAQGNIRINVSNIILLISV